MHRTAAYCDCVATALRDAPVRSGVLRPLSGWPAGGFWDWDGWIGGWMDGATWTRWLLGLTPGLGAPGVGRPVGKGCGYGYGRREWLMGVERAAR